MSAWYELQGTVKIKPEHKEKAQLIAEQFSELGGELCAYCETDEEDNTEVIFEGATSCSATTIGELDDLAQSLGPLALEPVMLAFVYENDSDWMYVGPPEEEAKAESALAYEQIVDRLGQLTRGDLEQLRNALAARCLLADSGKEKL